jgi:hypothetical protein
MAEDFVGPTLFTERQLVCAHPARMSDEHEPPEDPNEPNPPHPYHEIYRAYDGEAEIWSILENGETLYLVEVDGKQLGPFTNIRDAKKAAREALKKAWERRQGPRMG